MKINSQNSSIGRIMAVFIMLSLWISCIYYQEINALIKSSLSIQASTFSLSNSLTSSLLRALKTSLCDETIATRAASG